MHIASYLCFPVCQSPLYSLSEQPLSWVVKLLLTQLWISLEYNLQNYEPEFVLFILRYLHGQYPFLFMLRFQYDV